MNINMQTPLSDNSDSVVNNYIGLNDFVVDFSPEVESFFKEKIGEVEYRNICRKSCQAPP